MTSWQTAVLCRYLRATRKRRYATAERGLRAMATGRPAAPPPRVLRERVTTQSTAGFDVATVRPVERDAATAGAIVYLHGGSFISGIASQHWSLIAQLSATTNRGVHVPHYGLAPHHDAGEARAFLDAVVTTLRPRAPLHLVGDSAGGNLALLLAQSHPVAVAGLTLISPWLDLSLDNPDIGDVERVDPWLTRAGLRPIASRWAGRYHLHDPAVSPLLGDLDHLPTTEVLVGSRDICQPDCRRLQEAASSAVTLHVEDGSPHVYPLLPTPEGRRARAAIVRRVQATFASG